MLLCALAVGKFQVIVIDLDHRFEPVIRQYLVILLAVVVFYWYVNDLVIYMRFLWWVITVIIKLLILLCVISFSISLSFPLVRMLFLFHQFSANFVNFVAQYFRL